MENELLCVLFLFVPFTTPLPETLVNTDVIRLIPDVISSTREANR